MLLEQKVPERGSLSRDHFVPIGRDEQQHTATLSGRTVVTKADIKPPEAFGKVAKCLYLLI
jgi:hypothetical protein